MKLDSTTLLIIGLVVLVVISVFATLAIQRSSPAATNLPYEKEPYLFTRGERAFFFALTHAVDSNYRIFAKVRLIDIIRVRPGTPNTQSFKNRILSKHVDFILCSNDTFSPILAIELDDASHRSEAARQRDATKDAAFRAAGLPLLRIQTSSSYNPTDLSSRIQALLPTEALSASTRLH